MKSVQINIKKVLIKNCKYLSVAIIGFAVFIICSVCIRDGNIKYVMRAGIGDDSETKIAVEGLTDELQILEIPISARRYSDDEAVEAFAKGIDKLIEILKGKNQSLQNVTSKLRPVSEISDLGLKVKWDFKDSDLVDTLGNVYNEKLTESVDINIEAILSDGIREEIYMIPIRICPLPESERLTNSFLEYIKEIDEKERENKGYSLPEAFLGKSLTYKNVKMRNLHLIWIMGVIIAILLYLREKNNVQTQTKCRQRSLMKDYPEIVSKLIVFIGAGLSIRQALESIVHDYESEPLKEKRYAYEKLVIAADKLNNGTHESIVYKEFGRACALRQYMKLASLLEQNRRSGLSILQSLLSLESQSAWEERINLARREGEELSTKLLIPLFIMLVVVMMMIIVPALLTFY